MKKGEHQYKIGDKVQVVDECDFGFVNGTVCFIKSLTDSGYVVEDKYDWWYMGEYALELVDEDNE